MTATNARQTTTANDPRINTAISTLHALQRMCELQQRLQIADMHSPYRFSRFHIGFSLVMCEHQTCTISVFSIPYRFFVKQNNKCCVYETEETELTAGRVFVHECMNTARLPYRFDIGFHIGLRACNTLIAQWSGIGARALRSTTYRFHTLPYRFSGQVRELYCKPYRFFQFLIGFLCFPANVPNVFAEHGKPFCP